MTRGELLQKLFAQHSDPAEFRRVAEELIADEYSRGNRILSSTLKKSLETASQNRFRQPDRSSSNMAMTPIERDKRVPLTETVRPTRTKSDVILSATNTSILAGVLEELRRADLLRRHGLKPTSRMLFCGPPGCGKTICAEAFAYEAGLPLIVARVDVLVSSFLGETSTNLRQIFEFTQNMPSVLLLDEFDTVARTRDDDNEHGELKRVVNSLLQLIERYQGAGIIIAATNHESKLDSAIWRRFDQVIYFELPSAREIKALLKLKLKNFPLSFDPLQRVDALNGMTHAEVERVALNAIKISLLAGEKKLDEANFDKAIAAEKRRKRTIRKVQTDLSA
jgi:SpoVK/Ycf46/Vps4 family AAA+-type ATPase